MFIPILLFLVGLLLLIKGGDWFVDGATGIAHRFHLPELLIGATVVSIGTTLPEVMVSATSAIGGHPEMAYGNAIGSVICNTALIAAVTIAFRPGRVNRGTLAAPVGFFFLSAGFYAVIAYVFGGFTRGTGILLLLIFAAYLFCNVRMMRSQSDGKSDPALKPDSPDPENPGDPSLARSLFLLVIGAALITVGANLLVDNGILIAEALHVPEAVIALTFVALGTSLPELVTAVTSLIKGHSALSLGNVIGANVFNIVLVCGVSITLKPFDIPVSSEIFGLNASLVMDLPVMFLVMLILTVPALSRGRLSRVQGILLLLLYFAYCVLKFLI